jgi:hypothetical protein
MALLKHKEEASCYLEDCLLRRDAVFSDRGVPDYTVTHPIVTAVRTSNPKDFIIIFLKYH